MISSQSLTTNLSELFADLPAATTATFQGGYYGSYYTADDYSCGYQLRPSFSYYPYTTQQGRYVSSFEIAANRLDAALG
jgi:hypothetical protein